MRGIGIKTLCQSLARLKQVVDATMQKGSTERFCQIRISPYLITFFLILQRVFSSQQDNGDMTGTYIFFQHFTHRNSVHYGHHNITYDNIGNTTQCLLHALLPICSCFHFKIIGERFSNIITDVLIIFHYQQYSLSVGG